jgi:hypothetical protein
MMIRLAMLKVPAIGAAAAAAVGVMGGGMMRPDASLFERPGQTLIMEEPPSVYGQPTAWTGNGPIPSYVVGTDSLRPAYAASPDYAVDRAVYSDEGLMRPTLAAATPDTRPAKDDRADAIRDAQASSPEITTPALAKPTSFPSLDGDTLGGLTQTSTTLTNAAPDAIKTAKPIATLDALLGQIAGGDPRASDRIAGRQ